MRERRQHASKELSFEATTADTSKRIAKCVRELGNWSSMSKEHILDNPLFDPMSVAKDIAVRSPKLQALLDNIKSLDDQDINNHGKTFKHFIYTDVKSSYGAKLISAALMSQGWQHAYGIGQGARGRTFVFTKYGKGENVFAMLTSATFHEKNMGVNFRREILKKYNARPDNVYGQNMRIIILDSGFREGIDLFDVKYVHLFESLPTRSDEKRAIGRATRFCGQKGLQFDSKAGWPLHIYKYETKIPDNLKEIYEQYDTLFDIFIKHSNLDPQKITLANVLEPAVIENAVDRALTNSVHALKTDIQDVTKKPLTPLQKTVLKDYPECVWPSVKIENGCETTQATATATTSALVKFTPSQEFIRRYFTVQSAIKGMLLFHSVGCGKTCTAIATASSSFESSGYTILYVTRHTLKADVWKNMFDQTCSIRIQEMIRNGHPVPDNKAVRQKLINDNWFQPLSYKQFSNMLSGKNALFDKLVARNGEKDPLRKTLVIVDEVHKLYAPDVVGTEKPDIDLIKTKIQESFRTSGSKSVRLLFMTATPYTEDPMDFMRIINLMKLSKEQLPEDFASFSKAFLDSQGNFTERGKTVFAEAIAGHVSYLNREADIRTFAYPIIHHKYIQMSDYESSGLATSVANLGLYIKRLEKLAKYFGNSKTKVINEAVERMRAKLYAVVEETNAKLLECKKREHAQNAAAVEAIETMYKQQVADCLANQNVCLAPIEENYKAITLELRTNAKADAKECPRGDKECRASIRAKLTKNLLKAKQQYMYDKKQCTKANCRTKFTKEKNKKLKEVKTIKECKDLEAEVEKHKDAFKQLFKEKSTNPEFTEEEVQKLERIEQGMEFDRKELQELDTQLKDMKKQLANLYKTDRSQRTALNSCLGIKNKPPVAITEPVKLEDIPVPVESMKNVFLINGHGSETVVDFNKRYTLPKGYMLVMMPKCARPAWSSFSNVILGYFASKDKRIRHALANPVEYKDWLENTINTPIRIYLPGDKIPNISTSLHLEFEKPEQNMTVLEKSGVFRVGHIPRLKGGVKRLPTSLINYSGDRENIKQMQSYVGYVPGLNWRPYLQEMRRGSVYTPLSDRSKSVEKIMKSVGPGVYWFSGCRVVHTKMSDAEYKGYYDVSAKQQSKSPSKMKNKMNELIPYLVNNIPSPISPHNTPSPEPTPVKPQPKQKYEIAFPPKKNTAELTNEQKTVVKSIKKRLKEQDAKEISEELIDKWLKELRDLQASIQSKVIIKLIHDIYLWLGENYPNKVKAETRLVTRKKKAFVHLILQTVIVPPNEKKKLPLKDDIIGIIPHEHDDAENKCDTSLLLRKIKVLYKKEHDICSKLKIPVIEEKWQTNPERRFGRLCKRVAKYIQPA